VFEVSYVAGVLPSELEDEYIIGPEWDTLELELSMVLGRLGISGNPFL